MSMFDLSGNVTIITGSSRGMGRAIAEAYAAAGAKVVISSWKKAACDDVASAIRAKHGTGSAVGIAANISDKSALQALVARTRDQFGGLNIFVCNAASNPYAGLMTGISDEQFRKIFGNNVLSNHWLISMVAPEMMERKDGGIIVISSVGGLVGSETIGPYNISKAVDFQLVRNLAVEFGSDNVRINAIAPGVIRTDFARTLWEDPEAEAALQQAPRSAASVSRMRLPVRRFS